MGWQTIVPEFDPPTQELIGHWLAIGALNAAEPAWFERLIEAKWRFELFATQQPVVDGPVGGRVLYVADNGASSEVRVVSIDGTDQQLLGTVTGVVYAARLSPDGRSVYAVVLDRDTGRDTGLWRLSIEGDPTVELVMQPPAVDLARSGGIRLVATTRFVRTVRISADGFEVARLACGEPFGQCVLDVLNVVDGRVTQRDTPGQSGDLTAIGDGAVFGIDYCLTETRCVTQGTPLEGGEPQLYPGTRPAVDEDGHLMMLQFPSPTVSARGFFVTELDGTGTHLVLATDGGVRLIHQEGVDFEGVRMELPWGWVAVSFDWSTDDGGYMVIPAAVRLVDGGWVALTLPEIYPIGGGHD